MSAETLRKAASLMREVGEKAAAQTPVDVRAEGVWLNSRFYMVIDPAVALAVADWLDYEHANLSTYNAMTERAKRAFNVARAYLGDDA